MERKGKKRRENKGSGQRRREGMDEERTGERRRGGIGRGGERRGGKGARWRKGEREGKRSERRTRGGQGGAQVLGRQVTEWGADNRRLGAGLSRKKSRTGRGGGV